MKLIVGTKFQLELKILNFWTKLTQKGHFCSKTNKFDQKSPLNRSYSN